MVSKQNKFAYVLELDDTELFDPHLNNQVTGIFFLGILTHKKKCDPAGIYFMWSLLLLTSHQLQQP